MTNASTYLHRIHNNYAFGDVFNQHYQDCNQGCPCQQKFIRFNTHSHSPPFAAKATAQNATGGENWEYAFLHANFSNYSETSISEIKRKISQLIFIFSALKIKEDFQK